MTIEFRLPEVSEGVETADVAEIKVSEGDVIQPDQVVMELETEKAVVELPCPHGGRVVKVHVKPGDTVPIGAVLLTIDETVSGDAGKVPESGTGSGASVAAAPSAASAAHAVDEQGTAEAAAALEEPVSGAGTAAATGGGSSAAVVSEPAETLAVRPAGTPSTGEAESGEFRPPPPAGPATRRLARELGVDLYQVQGTGPGGRITKEDVKAYVRRLTQGAAGGAPAAQPTLPDFSQWGPVDREPMSKLGRSAAANLTTAWRVIPHVTQHDEADITDLEAARREFAGARDGVKITMTAVLIKAVVPLLKAYPKFNASFDATAGEIVYKRYYHIGCAVDTPHGLVVPVIRDVDQKSVRQVANELADLAARARDRKLAVADMQGASFTITNLGGIGGTAFTPIVNFPEVAILGVARSQPRLQLKDGELVERLWLPLSLSYDHRVINGADAARFLRALAVALEQPFRLLVDI